jgi:hypothetical protein
MTSVALAKRRSPLYPFGDEQPRVLVARRAPCNLLLIYRKVGRLRW